MDPYLEHPVLWEPVHRRLIVEMAKQLQPHLDPRYITSTEERVFVEGPQRRIPDVFVLRRYDEAGQLAVAEAETGSAIILEVEELELREPRVEILDVYNDLKLVAVIELVSPTNKHAGPGRDSYVTKQQELRARDVHLIEIDLLRNGERPLAIPEWRLEALGKFNYVASVNRWPKRWRYELYPMQLRQRLKDIRIPLSDPDPDVVLDVQAALDQVYDDGRFGWRLKYHEPCVPPLDDDDQKWADEGIAAWKAAGGADAK
jgi:hypothetical protein